jgi:hypothetical protein
MAGAKTEDEIKFQMSAANPLQGDFPIPIRLGKVNVLIVQLPFILR